jgi:hypothetical protein
LIILDLASASTALDQQKTPQGTTTPEAPVPFPAAFCDDEKAAPYRIRRTTANPPRSLIDGHGQSGPVTSCFGGDDPGYVAHVQ